MANKKNSSTTRNVRNQKNAERKARKVNRLAKNARKAREAKGDLYGKSETVKTKFVADDLSFDPKKEHAVATAVKLGDDLRTFVGTVPNSTTMEQLLYHAAGTNTALNGDGAAVLDFPTSWSLERVTAKMSSFIWNFHLAEEIKHNEGAVLYTCGDRFNEYVNLYSDDFTDWIADCGKAPDANGIIDMEVSSSAIRHVTYNANTRDMLVEFTSGGVYNYNNVPRKNFCSLVSAPSVGRYFHANIRDEYAYQRVA